MLMKCKPTYDFQSVEFDWPVQSDEDIADMEAMYQKILDMLVRIAPEQGGTKKAKAVPAEPLATEGQKKTMDRFNIHYDSTTTKKQATALIQASIDGLEG